MPCPLIRRPTAQLFAPALRRLRRRFACYAATSPTPLPAAGLQITPEIRYQSELYLPMDELRHLFFRYYQASLSCPPVLASTPFAAAPSWADCFAALPSWLQASPDPSRLFERLLSDADLHVRFIFASFLPARFNGPGFGRYPGQLGWLRCLARSLREQGMERLCCLDAACGSGEGSWELLELLAAEGWQPAQVRLQGWTLDPLEVYAAANRYLPHDMQRQQVYRQRTTLLTHEGWGDCVRFQAVDLLGDDVPLDRFDLILCNGLLGGPLVHAGGALEQVIGMLARRLRPGGWLLAANRFHGGWQRSVTQADLAGLFSQAGLVVQAAGEGIAGQRSSL